MNRITQLFKDQKLNILSVYFTAGFPELNTTVETIQTLEQSGVDLIEIGIPFSDPLADGPVIQQSSEVALENGMSIKVLFEQLKSIREQVKIPLILMGYFNPILQYGFEAFCEQAAAIGIDGLIIPDLPVEEYVSKYKTLMEQNNLSNVLLITPRTSESRIRYIDEHSSGFIYMVASSSITGSTNQQEAQEAYFERVRKMGLDNPLMIGFGIGDQESFSRACRYANGAIVGSAFIKAISEKGEFKNRVEEFIAGICPEKLKTEASHFSQKKL